MTAIWKVLIFRSFREFLFGSSKHRIASDVSLIAAVSRPLVELKYSFALHYFGVTLAICTRLISLDTRLMTSEAEIETELQAVCTAQQGCRVERKK
jgi:hypothetical protein